METTILIDLVNAPFTLKLGEKEYMVRKANIRQVMAYREFLNTVKDDPLGEWKTIAYCTWLLLKDNNPDLTQEILMDQMRGDVDAIETLIKLGFINPEKMEMIKRLQTETKKILTGQDSSPLSPTEPAGDPSKSVA